MIVKTLAVAAMILTGGTAVAQACDATVRGLSGRYDLATGSGFLAIRAQPTARSRMVGQTFNGNALDVIRTRGRWWFVYDYGSGKRGWVYSKYARWGCGD